MKSNVSWCDMTRNFTRLPSFTSNCVVRRVNISVYSSIISEFEPVILNLIRYIYITLSKVSHYPFQVPYHPLQSTRPPSLKCQTTLFKVPYHPLQSTTLPSSNQSCTYMYIRLYFRLFKQLCFAYIYS